MHHPVNRAPVFSKIAQCLCWGYLSLCLVMSSAVAQDLSKIPAFLPTLSQVPASQPMPIDGTWTINTINKQVRIESGRVSAVEGWLHLLVLQIQPGMVVIKDLAPTGPGKYSGQDLPLMGTLSAQVQSDRSLAVTVQTALMGAVNYRLIPVQLINPQWYAQEMQAAGLGASVGGPSPPAYQFTPPPDAVGAPPAYSPPVSAPAPSPQGGGEGCEEVYDPATDTVSCYEGGE